MENWRDRGRENQRKFFQPNTTNWRSSNDEDRKLLKKDHQNGQNWRSSDTTVRKFFKEGNEENKTNWGKHNYKNTGPQQTQRSRSAVRSTISSSKTPFKSANRSSSWKSETTKSNILDLIKLEEFLNEDTENLISKLVCESTWFSQLLDSVSDLSFDCIVVIIRIIARVSECSLGTHTSEIIKIAYTDLFLLQLKNMILILPHQTEEEERNRASYFWRDINDFYRNLNKYFELVFSLSPTIAIDILPKFVQIVLVGFPHLTVLSDETKMLFETLQEKLTAYQAEIDLKYKKKDKTTEESELEPPDDFRWISLYPLPLEITSRKRAFVRSNIIVGPYRNVEHYLDVQFRLLREDFVKPLREGICDYMDGGHNHKLQNIRIYKNVKLLGPSTCPNSGTCGVLIQIEIKDKAKYIQRIQNSRRFMYGSLVCFTMDNFSSVIFGKIIGRDNSLLKKGQLIIEFEGVRNIEYNVNCVMVESNVFFEPYYHVLKVLQNIQESSFPMAKYIVDVSTEMEPPRYPLPPSSKYSLLSLYDFDDYDYSSDDDVISLPHKMNDNVGQIIEKNMKRILNEAQFQAYQAAMNHSLCIIQGPPGTGKTYLGLIIAKALLEQKSKWYHNCYPLLVVCCTNHALDQFLEGLLSATHEIIRIGGQSKNEKLDEYNIKNRRRFNKRRNENFFRARNVMNYMHTALQKKHFDFRRANEFLGVVDILELLKTLPELLGTWFEVITKTEFRNWLLEGQIQFQMRQTRLPKQARQNDFYEDVDEGLVNIADDPNEQYHLDMDDIFSTNFEFLPESSYIISVEGLEDEIFLLGREKYALQKDEENYARISKINMEISSLENTMEYLKARMVEGKHTIEFRQTAPIDFNDPMSIHPDDRWSLYFYWLNLYVANKMEEITKLQYKYQAYYEIYEGLRAVEDVRLMRDHLVVGMTTTSAARLRGSLRKLKSPIVIVEEAAEIMESQVVASLTEHCGHLILLGDHQQLRPNTADYTMEKKYNLGISLFERLITNSIPCNVLNVQHRMRPEIARLISPNIYPNLENHKSVDDFPPICGVQSSLYFITHTNPEERSMDESKSNLYEVKFLLHLAQYLLWNGYESEDITILAAYSGQMFLMRREVKNFDNLQDVRIAVLDNYQGEESKIILLSLVRNNSEGKIGFLSIENRVCVALSRAREGMYIMGNMDMLSSNSDLWKKMRTVLEEMNSLGTSLPLQCQNHADKITYITDIHDFSKVRNGGCDLNCKELLNCGHRCALTCHTWDTEHEEYVCKEKCTRILCEREHVCPKLCYSECGKCMVLVPQKLECGHEMNYACSDTILQCLHPVAAELPCKHKIDNKPCYRNIKDCPCPFPCAARLDKCGHACVQRCHMNDDPDHLEVKCYKQCMKYRRNCSMTTDKHPCPKYCYEACDICKIEIKKKRSCSHFYDIACCDDVEKTVCKKPCKKQLPCGHPCKMKCNEACGNCKEQVKKLIPECGHEISIVCSKEPSRSDCKNDCQLKLSCGHKCYKKCSEKCTTQCNVLVDGIDSLLCGHRAKIPCHMNNTDSIKQLNAMRYCREPCSALLECGHVCSGSCGLCHQGRIHQICKKNCDAVLVCGHKCRILCNQPCPPCVMQACMYRCSHEGCRNKCGNPCKPCHKRCSRRCRHVKCTNYCFQKCSVSPCNEPCKKLLDCGHQCIGFCGEPCPHLCMTCNRDELLAMGHEEEEDGARFVLLQECNHIIESKRMQKWLETDQIGVRKCPICLISLTVTKRYSEYINDSKDQLQTVKNKFFGKSTKLRSLQDSLYRRLEENYRSMEVFRRASKINPYKEILKGLKQGGRKQAISNMSRTILESKVQILEHISKLMNGLLSQERTTKCLQYIDFLLERLTLHQNSMTEQEVNDYTIEMRRLERILQLDDIEQCYPSVTEKDLYKSLSDRLYSYLRYNLHDDEANKNDLQTLCEDMGGDVTMIKDTQLSVIVKAVGLKNSAWHLRKCPSNHTHIVEKSVDVIDGSDCNDCKA